MSRCFPFPPPGYEKKARIADVDLLKKEKHKEKKHKKEKKDKEKREHKGREEKDKKSDEKHRDKKDRKEKSKEKKKDKEREKGRDKGSTSQEKQTSALVESHTGDYKLNHKDREWIKDQNITTNEKKQTTPFRGYTVEKPAETSLSNDVAVDKFVLDLCNRIKDEEKGYASQSMDRSPFTGQTNHYRMGKNENGIMHIDKEKKENRRVDIRKMGGLGVNVGGTINIKNETGNMHVEKGMIKEDKRVDIRHMLPHVVGKEKIENRGPNVGGGFQNKAEEIPRSMEKGTEPRDKDRKKEREVKRESKRKDKNKEKKSHGKDKERDRERKKEERAKEKKEQKIKVKDTVKNGLVVTQNIKLPQLFPDGDRNPPVVNRNKKLPQLVPNGDINLNLGENVKSPPFFPDGDRNLVISQNLKLSQVPDGDGNLYRGQNIKLPPFVAEGDRSPSVEVNLKKRRHTEGNGCLYEKEVAPNKKPRPSPQPSIENGRKLAPCRTPVLTPGRKVPSPNSLIKVNNNELKINGMIEVHPLSISMKRPPSSSSSSTTSSSKIKSDQVAKAPQVKPPHLDTKYLSEVLSVPKIEEWRDFDDEEWLFSSKGHVTTSVWPTEALETPRVWAEAVKIELADVCALPYVIPY